MLTSHVGERVGGELTQGVDTISTLWLGADCSHSKGDMAENINYARTVLPRTPPGGQS